MDFLSLENESVITPSEVVIASLSAKAATERALALDEVAIITFTRCDLLMLVEETGAQKLRKLQNFFTCNVD